MRTLRLVASCLVAVCVAGASPCRAQAPSATPSPRAQAGTQSPVEFASRDYPWEGYSALVYKAVHSAWLRELYNRAPRLERDRMSAHLETFDAEVTIRFVIRYGGEVENVEVLVPSKLPALDEASKAALKRCVMPALPADCPRDRERVTFIFRISGFQSARQLQLQLEYAHQNGDF